MKQGVSKQIALMVCIGFLFCGTGALMVGAWVLDYDFFSTLSLSVLAGSLCGTLCGIVSLIYARSSNEVLLIRGDERHCVSLSETERYGYSVGAEVWYEDKPATVLGVTGEGIPYGCMLVVTEGEQCGLAVVPADELRRRERV